MTSAGLNHAIAPGPAPDIGGRLRARFVSLFASFLFSVSVAGSIADANPRWDSVVVSRYFGGKNEVCLAHEDSGYSRLWTTARPFVIEREVHQNRYGSCSVTGHWFGAPRATVHLSASDLDCQQIKIAANPVMLQAAPDHICGVGHASPEVRRTDRAILEGSDKYRYDPYPLDSFPMYETPSDFSECEDSAKPRSVWLHRSYRIVDRLGGMRVEQCMIAFLDEPDDAFPDAEPTYLSADVSVCHRFEHLDRHRDDGRLVRVAILRRQPAITLAWWRELGPTTSDFGTDHPFRNKVVLCLIVRD